MLVLLSPSKTQDFTPSARNIRPTQPPLLDESQRLVQELRRLSPEQLGKLMTISDKLATLNHERYRQFSAPFTPDNAKPAIFAFKGDVYDGLDAESLPDPALQFAQHSLRILSGLYGVLRPFDLIQPYRLEMKTALANPRGKDLYHFWGERITHTLNQQLDEENTDTVLNLASNEYFKAIQPNLLNARLVTAHFKEEKSGTLKIVGLFAKKARGMMARYIAQQGITHAQDIKDFTSAGYRFRPELSSESEFVFARSTA